MLDDCRYGTVTGEKMDRGYMGRILMMTVLVPDMVEAILDGQQPEEASCVASRRGARMGHVNPNSCK